MPVFMPISRTLLSNLKTTLGDIQDLVEPELDMETLTLVGRFTACVFGAAAYLVPLAVFTGGSAFLILATSGLILDLVISAGFWLHEQWNHDNTNSLQLA